MSKEINQVNITLSITKKVLKNSVYNFLTTIISRIGGLIFTIIVARILFPELFGLYSIALTAILTIATFTDLGINSTLIRYLAECLKEKTKKTEIEARSRFYFLLNFKIALTALTALVLFLLSEIISVYIFKKPALILPLQLGSIYLFAISFQSFFNSAFYALQKVQLSAVGETIFQLLRIALVVLLLQAYKNVGSVFISLSIASFVSFLFLYLALFKRDGFLLSGKRMKLEAQKKKRLLSFFGWLTILSVSLIFFVHIDTFMLGAFLPAEFAGYYHAPFSIIGAVAAFVAFGAVLLPVFTQLEKGKLERGFKKVFRYVLLMAFPAAFGLAFVAVPATQIIYGQAYVPTEYKLAITITVALLSLLILEGALGAVFSALFQSKEQPKIPAILIAIATVANIILNYIFIKIGISIAPQYGLVGVAAATLIVRYGNVVSLGILARKRLNIKISKNLLIKPLMASLIMLGFLFIVDYFVTMSIFTGILMIIAAAIIYIIFMLLIKGIKKEDFELMLSLKKSVSKNNLT